MQHGSFSIVPIRHEDRHAIMKWRNEQIYHLRQVSVLTEQQQDNYFNTVVNSLFEKENPDQLLFSYLDGDKCIGYGGIVHISWIDRNAEISFIINTSLEEKGFHFHWSVFLNLIEQVAFSDLRFHKLYTYAFDLRPHLYEVLEANSYKREAKFEDHVWIDGRFRDVIIHSKIADE